ncbi:MAG: hypothetical protein ACFB4I_03585 [Cyanophyceae cyanobacterium]
MSTKSCPCCQGTLLRHIRCNKIYWYCSSCRQNMPDWPSLTREASSHRREQRGLELMPEVVEAWAN